MDARDAIVAACNHRGISRKRLSEQLGMERHYTYGISRGNVRIDTFATVMDKLGYDVIARSRSDGFSIRIPPE